MNKKRTLREREGDEIIQNSSSSSHNCKSTTTMNGKRKCSASNEEQDDESEESRFGNTNIARSSGEEIIQKKIKVD